MSDATSRPKLSEADPSTRQRDRDIRTTAVRLFFDHGYNAVGIRQIADALSINSATLYHYYPSKLAILESIMEDSNRRVLEDGLAALGAAPSVGHRFAYLAGALIAAQVSSPKTCFLLDYEVQSIDRAGPAGERILRSRREYEELWRGELKAGMRRRDYARQDQDVLRLSLLSMLSSPSLWYRPNDAVTAPEICLRVVGLALRMVGGDPLTKADERRLGETLSFAPWPSEPPTEGRDKELPWFTDFRAPFS
jgi:AcrR family transcriptional regulator